VSEATVEETGGRRRRGKAVTAFLVADRAPMWFTVAALLAGSAGT